MSSQLITIAIDSIIIPENYPSKIKSSDTNRIQNSVASMNALKSKGIPLPPVIVARKGKSVILVKGLRRLACAKAAGESKIDALLMDFQDSLIASCVYQTNTKPSNTLDMAWAIHYLHTLDYSNQDISILCGFGKGGSSMVSRYLRILQLPSEVQILIEDEQLDFSHACELIGVDRLLAVRLAELCVRDDLNLTQFRLLKKRWTNPDSEGSAAVKLSAKHQPNENEELKVIERQLADWFPATPTIKAKPSGEFVLAFSCKTPEALTEILEKLQMAATTGISTNHLRGNEAKEAH